MKQYQDTLDILLNGRDGYRVVFRGDRTGTGTFGFFGHQMRFDLSEGFPLLTTKTVNFKAIVNELIWFLRGETNIKNLDAKIWDEWAVTWKTIHQHLRQVLEIEQHPAAQAVEMSEDIIILNVPASGDFVAPEGWTAAHNEQEGLTVYTHPDYHRIVCERLHAAGLVPDKDWERYTAAIGELGPVYGAMWRSWSAPEIYLDYDQETKASFMQSGLPFAEWLKTEPEVSAKVKLKSIDQIAELIENLKSKPYSRRHVISGWNPAVLPDETVKPDVNALRGKQALPPCHTLFQFYVEPMDVHDRMNLLDASDEAWERYEKACLENNQEIFEELTRYLDAWEVPDKRLSCQLYQR